MDAPIAVLLIVIVAVAVVPRIYLYRRRHGRPAPYHEASVGGRRSMTTTLGRLRRAGWRPRSDARTRDRSAAG